MKTILIGSFLGYAALVAGGLTPCPCEFVGGAFDKAFCSPAAEAAAPAGLYLEARDATVWGGACHVSGQAQTGGSCAAMGWCFETGSWEGISLRGVRAAATLEGTANLAGHVTSNRGSAAERSALLWVDAPSDEAAAAAESYLRSSGVLGNVVEAVRGSVQVSLDGDAFKLAVGDLLEVTGEARADRACCSMPESRWYSTLAETSSSVVAVPEACRFEGHRGLAAWSFEEENSAFVARFGT